MHAPSPSPPPETLPTPSTSSSHPPPLTVSALSLRDIPPLPYARFRLHPTSPARVADRAKWLEHGAGYVKAFSASALALITEIYPAALAAIISSRPSPQKPPVDGKIQRPPPASHFLWVFAPTDVLAEVKNLVADAFTLEDDGVWTPHAHPAVTAALLQALQRAMVRALEAEGALTIGSELVHPCTQLAYTLRLSVPPHPAPHVLVKVTVRNRSLRRLQDVDSARVLLQEKGAPPFKVVTAPLGMEAVLVPRHIAGDALSASVLKRWGEAGLLPAGELKDSAVVFVKLQDGIVVPFPRVCLLTAEPQGQTSMTVNSGITDKSTVGQVPPVKQGEHLIARKPLKGAGGTPRSRKRPRSPSPNMDETATSKVEPKKEMNTFKDDPLAKAEALFAANAPTAQSLNNALDLAKKGGLADPVPVVHHPLVDPIPPPSFEVTFDEKVDDEKAALRTEPTTSETHNSPHTIEKASAADERDKVGRAANGVVSNQQAERSSSATALKVEQPEPKPSHSANGIDSFLLDGDSGGLQESCGGFGSGPSVDMNDFGALDDEVAEFFQNGMEDKLQGGDNVLSNTEEPDASNPNQPQHGDREGDHDVSLSQTNGDPNRQNRDTQMDVDTEGQKEVSDTSRCTTDGPKSKLRSRDVMALALSSLRKAAHASRPDDKAIGSKVSSFFEDDLTERRLAKLGVVSSLGKRRLRSKYRSRRIPAQLNHDTCSKPRNMSVSVYSGSSLFTASSQPSYKVGTEVIPGKGSDFYIPKRRLRTYSRLRREGKDVIKPNTLARLEREETDISDSDSESASDVMKPSGLGLLGELGNTTVLSGSGITSLSGNQKPALHAESTEDDENIERTPAKIMEAVAVDCASVCMVLTASRTLKSSGSPISGATSFSGSPESNSSPVISRDDDLPKVLPPHNTSKPGMYSSVPKVQALSQSSSPISRSTTGSKRDRELLGILALLEMQAFSVRDLDLFRDDEKSERTEQFALRRKELTLSEQESEPVSVATVRRVLMGLPRVLETSRIFSGHCDMMRELGNATTLKVTGPLPVQDMLGETASVVPLEPARVCIGYNKNWVEAPSGVLPLWEKAGLEPYSERKNVEYVAVAPKEIESDVRLFLRDVSAAYEECSFGRHAAMPFEAVTLIANSKGKAEQRGRQKNPDLLSDTDRAMAQQYHLAITGLCTKLASVAQDYRKNHNETAKNIVVYVVSPFENTETAANVFLLKGVAPLVSTIPGTVPSMVTTVGSSSPGSALPAAPWRSSAAPRSTVSITVRVIPREVVDRQLSGHAEIECLLDRPLRPQLVKAVSFAVFSSIRTKRVRTSQMDGEVARVLARTPLMPDDLMSPMTPEIAAESPGGSACNIPVSPKGGTTDEVTSSPPTGLIPHNSGFMDQYTALAPSFLHEPAIILSGVGKHMGQTESKSDIVFHLGYTLCESSSRYVFAWTDQRGEMLDIATVPISKLSLRQTRRKAFWCMWARGQRWKISFVQDIHATICKYGELIDDEIQDWEWVISKTAQKDESADRKGNGRLVRRFPPADVHVRGDDVSDLYTDHPTPATPGNAQPGSHGSGAKSAISMEIKMPQMSSVSLFSASRADEHVLTEGLEKTAESTGREFAVVSQSSLSKGGSVQASAVLARFEDSGMNGIELNLARHYGKETEGEEMSDERSPWDATSAQAIAHSVVMNFHELRYVGAPPSWPSGRWLTILPVHLDIVRRFALHIRNVHRFALLSNTTPQR